MLIGNIYQPTLIDPVSSGKANTLYIVSGYASATFTRRHLVDLLKQNTDLTVNLIIGMPNAKNDHMAFVLLHKEFEGKFKGYYFQGQTPVHCKVYSWYMNEKPSVGFAGSANYSQFGFFKAQQLNQLTQDDPTEIKELFDQLLINCIYIPDHKYEAPIKIRSPKVKSVKPGGFEWEIYNKRVTISFLDRRGDLPNRSGLNWGQRMSKTTNTSTGEITWKKREPNQAYLSLKGDSRKEGFLPNRAYNFSLITDDGNAFDCVVAQDGRKAIHSTNNNSELGLYFRQRIGLQPGQRITVEDLEEYGRTDYTIEKIDDETYLLDFSVDN